MRTHNGGRIKMKWAIGIAMSVIALAGVVGIATLSAALLERPASLLASFLGGVIVGVIWSHGLIRLLDDR
jgi:hypothetical protein